MATPEIHSGTSSGRGIIAEDFRFLGVRRASAAIAGQVLAPKKNPMPVVGYDTRFLSEKFARASALKDTPAVRILAGHGITATTTGAKGDVLFDGTGPGPSEENLAPPGKFVLENKSLAGMATEGDADRFGIPLAEEARTWIIQ
jgi:phosphomannomutase